MTHSRRRPHLRALFALLLPLLTAASCQYDLDPPAFEESGAVLRGTRAGALGSGEDSTEFRLENLTSHRTGPAAFAFEGDVRFESGEVARIEGTAVGEEPFADPYRAPLAPSSPPPSPAYDLEATIRTEERTLLWQLTGARDRHGSGYDGEATHPSGDSTLFRFGGNMRDDSYHLMGFGAHPTTVTVGEPVTFAWSMWAGENADLQCRMYVMPRHPLVEVDECATRESFTFTYERHPNQTGPLPGYARLEVSADGTSWWEYETTFTLVLPDDASTSP